MVSNVESPLVPRKCYSYIRFSGKRQEAGDSYRRQESMAVAAAAAEGIPLDDTLSLDDKGVSAYRGLNWKRGNLGKFLDLVDGKLIPAGSVLIIERVNRLSRQPWMEQVKLWEDILQRGIIIRTCEPASRYTAENINELTVGCPVVLFMMLGHLESQQKGQWVQAAWNQKKKLARSEHVPHGRNRPGWLEAVSVPHPKDPRRTITTAYRLIEDRADTIRWIFEQAVAGLGTARIARLLNDNGTPSFQRAGWTGASVRNILLSRAAIGEYQPGIKNDQGHSAPIGPPIPHYYPAVVGPEVFAAAHAALRSRRKKAGRHSEAATNLFTHLAFHALDGKPLHCQNQTRRGRSWTYLATYDRRTIIPYPVFEQAILEAISQLTPKDVDGRHQADSLNARVELLQRENAQLRLQRDALDQQLRELPPQRWPQRVVAIMADVDEAIVKNNEDLRVAKEAANSSTRTDTLADIQGIVPFLATIKGTPQEASTRHRLKVRLRLLVEQIWIKVERINKNNRFIHVRIYLHGGECRYYAFTLGVCAGATPDTRLRDVDFRAAFAARKEM